MMVVDGDTETEMMPTPGDCIYIVLELGGPTFSFCPGPYRLCRQTWMVPLIGPRVMRRRCHLGKADSDVRQVSVECLQYIRG